MLVRPPKTDSTFWIALVAAVVESTEKEKRTFSLSVVMVEIHKIDFDNCDNDMGTPEKTFETSPRPPFHWNGGFSPIHN